VRLSNTGKLEEVFDVTPHACREWRFVACPPLQAHVDLEREEVTTIGVSVSRKPESAMLSLFVKIMVA
jgi:hypothetical protein